VTQQVNTAVKGVEPPLLEAVVDCSTPEALGSELPPAYHPTLPSRQRGNPPLQALSRSFYMYVMHNLLETRIHLSFLAHCAPRGHASEPLLYCQTHNCNQPHQAVTDTP